MWPCPQRSARASTIFWLLLYAMQLAAAAVTCDSECQQEQQAALLDIYSSTNGSGWTPGLQIGNLRWGSNTSAALPLSLPVHCSWAGVICCQAATGFLFSYKWRIVGMKVPCSTPDGSVTRLQLAAMNLVGTLPQNASTWAALAPTLEYLDFTGARLTCLCAVCTLHC